MCVPVVSPVTSPVKLPANAVEVILVALVRLPPVIDIVPSVIVGAVNVCPVSTDKLPSTLVTPSN